MQHLFILCYGRTGSTVVQVLLNRLDGYCIRGERKFILTGLAKAAAASMRSKSEFTASDRQDGVRSPHYGIAETDPDRFATALANLFTQEMLAPPPGTRVCGTKDVSVDSPRVSKQEFQDIVSFIIERFESSRIIFLTRSADEVAQSGWWVNRDPKDVQEVVAETDARFAQACEQHPERTFHLDYSEFKDSVDGFRRLLNWLGEPIDEVMLAEVASTRLLHLKNTPDQTNPPSPSLLRRIKRKAKRILP